MNCPVDLADENIMSQKLAGVPMPSNFFTTSATMFRNAHTQVTPIHDASKRPVMISTNMPIVCLQECVGDADKLLTVGRFWVTHTKPDEKPDDLHGKDATVCDTQSGVPAWPPA